MARNSGVNWTDHTAASIVGCSMEGPECARCYAIDMAARLVRMHEARKDEEPWARVHAKYAGLTQVEQRAKGDFLNWTGEVRFDPTVLADVRAAGPRRDGRPAKWFWSSMGDLFHDALFTEPALIGVLDQHLECWLATPWHIHQLLTKRTWLMGQFFRAHGYGEEKLLPPHLWAGCTIGTETRLDEHMEALGEVPAGVRWVSAEPLLDRLDLRPWLEWRWDRSVVSGRWELVPRHGATSQSRPWLDWLVLGGESRACGREPRECDPDWLRDLLDQAVPAGVKVWVKQTGEKLARRWKLRSTHGSRIEEWPAWMQRQEFPCT